MPIFYKGTLRGKRTNTFTNKETNTQQVTNKLQFIDETPNGISQLDIKIPDNVSPAQFTEGQEITVPITVSSYNGNIYYTLDGDAFNAVGPQKR